MAIYDDLKQEELADLLRAYDQYLTEASNTGAYRTGWVPVCVEEFYDSEYQDVWKRKEPFSDYFFDAVDLAAQDLSAQSLAAAIDTFYWVYDSYNYMDEISDRAEAISRIENDILSGKIDELKSCLQAEIDERAEANSATLALKIIIGQLNQYQKQQQPETQKYDTPQKFSDISDALLSEVKKGLDVWVTSTEGDELQFANTQLHEADYDSFSSRDKWLFDLPVECVHRNDAGGIDSVILNSGLTGDELIFLMDLEPALLVDASWSSAMQRAKQENTSFDDRLAYLRERSPVSYLDQIENAFEAVGQAVNAVDQAEINGLKLHPSIGNHLITARTILSEVLDAAKEEARNADTKRNIPEDSADMIFDDIKKQLEKGINQNEYGEPQAFFYLNSGRSIEVTLEQYGLAPDEQFYSVRLHCNSKEYDNGDYRSTAGIIEQFASTGLEIEEVGSLISSMLLCNHHYPVAEHSLMDTSAHTEGDIHFDQVVADAHRRRLQKSTENPSPQKEFCLE